MCSGGSNSVAKQTSDMVPKAPQGNTVDSGRDGSVPFSTTTKSHPTGLPGLLAAIKVKSDSIKKRGWTGGQLPHSHWWMNGRIALGDGSRSFPDGMGH
jgi:hypothetical protein